MKKKLLNAVCLVVVLMMVLSLVACGGAAKVDNSEVSTLKAEVSTVAAPVDEKITVKLYAMYSDEQQKIPLDYAQEFLKKEMPNVTVDLEVAAQDDNQKIKTYAASGNLPDVFVIDANLEELFNKSNNLLDLSSYIKSNKIDELIMPAALSLATDENGKIFAIPAESSFSEIIFYNKELFAANNVKVPANYDELLLAVKTFNEKKILPMAIFAKQAWPAIQIFDMISTRTEPMGILGLNSGKTKITDDVYLDSAKKFTELVKAGLTNKNCFTVTYDDALAGFIAGKSAMFPCGTWGLKEIGDKMGDKVDFLYPNSVFGTSDAAAWNMSGGGLGQGYAVSANTTLNKEIVGKWASLLAIKASEGRTVKQGEMNSIVKNCPPPESPYNTIQSKFAGDTSKFVSTTLFDWGLSNTKVKNALEKYCQNLLTGEFTPEAFVEGVDKETK